VPDGDARQPSVRGVPVRIQSRALEADGSSFVAAVRPINVESRAVDLQPSCQKAGGAERRQERVEDLHTPRL